MIPPKKLLLRVCVWIIGFERKRLLLNIIHKKNLKQI